MAFITRENIKNKRFLVLSAVFPPDVIGGAEMSASNLTRWLQRNGAEVGVLTTAKSRDEVCDGEDIDGLKTWRVWMPRPYPKYYFAKSPKWQKPIWHLQDHFDPRNRRILGRVLDMFKPDFINIHVLQGLGYNMLQEIAARDIQITYFLHDLGLACIRMAMFRNGRECAHQCTLCKLSSSYKAHLISGVPRLGFCSPSKANLEKLARYFPVGRRKNTVIINANKYPDATIPRTQSERLRILYVGRLDPSKGIHLLLQVAGELAATHDLSLTIVGTGPQEAELKKKYGALPWCHFTGFVSQAEISNIMMNSDLLCIPSIWAETLGGVVVHALVMGLPVIGSDTGGIPELIEPEKNGLLVPPGDAAAWRNALLKVLSDPALLLHWREYAESTKYRFDQDNLGNAILDFIYSVA